jgi:hypothetical protein
MGLSPIFQDTIFVRPLLEMLLYSQNTSYSSSRHSNIQAHNIEVLSISANFYLEDGMINSKNTCLCHFANSMCTPICLHEVHNL